VIEYEISVAGTLGPVVASMFPSFSVTPVRRVTALSGTVSDTAELVRVICFLQGRGCSPFGPVSTAATTFDMGNR
jgi:hypothetical protein